MIAGKKVPLTSASFLRPGEIVTTTENSRVDLMLLPGVLVELAGAGEVEITQLRLVRDGDETIHPMVARDAKIRLHRGTLIASVGLAQTDSHLFVETPDGTLIAGPDRVALKQAIDQVIATPTPVDRTIRRNPRRLHRSQATTSNGSVA